MLLPKKVKYRKWQKGRSMRRRKETRGISLEFGSFGLQALESAWVNSRQIEAGRRAMSNFTKRSGKIWIRIFPDKPITKRPPEVTMGGGKGAVDHYVFPVRTGRVLFEIDGVGEKDSRRALTLAGNKLPLKTRVIASENQS